MLLSKIKTNATATAISSAGRLLILSILSYKLGADEFAVFFMLFWLSEIYILLFHFGINAEFVRYLKEIKHSEIAYTKDRFIKYIWFMFGGLALILCLYLSFSFLGQYLDKINIWIYFSYLFLYAIFVNFRYFLRGLENYSDLIWIEFLYILGPIIYLSFSEGITIDNIFLIQCAAIVVLIFKYLKRLITGTKKEFKLQPSKTQEMKSFAINMYIIGLVSFFIWNRGEMYFVSNFSSEVVAAYGIALTISGMIFQVSMMGMTALLPHYAGLNKKNLPQENSNVTKFMLYALSIIVLFAIPNIELIIRILFSDKYVQSSNLSVIMILAAASFFYDPSKNYLLIKNRSDLTMQSNLFGSFVLIFLCLFLAKTYGVFFIAFTKLIITWLISLFTIYWAKSYGGLLFSKELVKSFFIFFMSIIFSVCVYAFIENATAKFTLSLLGLSLIILYINNGKELRS